MGCEDVQDRVKVLYIGGYSRSGSTLLMRTMAQAPGVTAVGELVYIWRRGYLENQLCGCGTPFRACDFWNAVSVLAFGQTPSQVPSEDYEKLQEEVHGRGTLVKLRSSRARSNSYRRLCVEYEELLERLYSAIARTSQSRLIVDSSKIPAAARLLSEVSGVDLHVAHLVRDSRATAFSWQRHKTRTEIHWTRKEMDRFGVIRSSYSWASENSLLYLDRAHSSSYTVVRYEDFVRQPAETLGQIARTIGEQSIARELLTMTNEVWLDYSHTVSGNPERFNSGHTAIAADREWELMMPVRQRLLVTALTGPLLAAFGYPIGPVLPWHLGPGAPNVRGDVS